MAMLGIALAAAQTAQTVLSKKPSPIAAPKPTLLPDPDSLRIGAQRRAATRQSSAQATTVLGSVAGGTGDSERLGP